MKNGRFFRHTIVITMVMSLVAASLSGCFAVIPITLFGCYGISDLLSDISDFSYTDPDDVSDHNDISGELSYEEYDISDFLDGCDELISLSDSKAAAGAARKYEELYAEFLHICENNTAIYIKYCEDPSDGYISDLYITDTKNINTCSDTLLSAIKQLCTGPCSESFRKYIGNELFDAYASYEPASDEQTEINDQLVDIADRYQTALSDIENASYVSSDDYEELGELYVTLVGLNDKLAKSCGYDNYAEYADREIYGRDYSDDDIESFYASVKEIASRYNTFIYDSQIFYAPYYIDTSMEGDEMLSLLAEYAAYIDTTAGEAAEELADDKLYNIGYDDDRISGAYTISLPESEKSYIFATLDGYYGDFVTLTHEFGHFTEDTVNSDPNILLYSYGSLDLTEIHSNGLQALYTYYYPEIFGDHSDIMSAYCVSDLLANIIDGCFYDEFQREIYKDPTMTLDEINALYYKLQLEYDVPESERDEYGWIYVSHNFESPMYYFSYAVSGLTALQIWFYTRSDMDTAVGLWENFINAGSYEYSYDELTEMFGISGFTDRTSVIVLCDAALSYVEEIAN